MKTIAITGASGAMGKETLKAIMASPYNYKAKLLLLKSDKFFATKVKCQYKDRVEIIFGDIRSYDDCLKLTKDSDYVLHLAALIPPKSDYDEDLTIAINYGGTKNIVDSIISLENRPKLIHISTVAIYGHRNYNHPWGRVGDPLLPSVFDVYATSKMHAERYVLESGLVDFAVLRQTGILYDNLLMKNISDGLMFHTPWNVPIEWVTARDSGRLMASIIDRDIENSIPHFWKRVYNIGGGASCRQTGYDTFDDGFKIIGGSVETFFEPNWNPNRNFHCFWFEDSNILNDMFHFQMESNADFWKEFSSKHSIYGVARILPASIIRKLVIERLLKNQNAPMCWVQNNDIARVTAAFGSKENIDAVRDWKEFPLLNKGQLPNGNFDYECIKNSPTYHKLYHGYDESKPDSELDIEDMQQAAKYRGGECLSVSMVKGDLYTPLKWRCHLGHIFYATPYTILKAGHWCDECCAPLRKWNYDNLVPHIPFYQDIWYDSHAKGENYTYFIQNGLTYLQKESA